MDNNYNNIIYDSLMKLLHLKGAKYYVRDIMLASNAITNFNPGYATLVLKKLVHKYKQPLNQLGKHLTGVIVFSERGIYSKKSEYDLMVDLHYVLRSIVIFGSVQMGIEPSIYHMCKKIKSENLDLFNIEY